MTMITIWWFVSAHKWFKGPKVYISWLLQPRNKSEEIADILFYQVNIEHQMLGRDGNVVEGKDQDSGDSSAGSITKEDRDLDDKRAADLA